MGYAALDRNSAGSTNTAIGDLALYSTFGNSNTAIGYNAGFKIVTASNVTCIGANVGGENVSSTTWIGGVYGVTTQSGTTAPVVVSDSGQLGTASSSRRFKKEIKPMDKASEAILALKPVMFHYNSDTKDTPQFGLIAEDVAAVNPDLVVRDKNGEIYTVRYDAVNTMLLNEFLKQYRTVQELKSTIAKQEVTIAEERREFQTTASKQDEQIQALTALMKEQASEIQKVSAELQMQKTAARTLAADD
jgi:Chaperone of endosialidase